MEAWHKWAMLTVTPGSVAHKFQEEKAPPRILVLKKSNLCKALGCQLKCAVPLAASRICELTPLPLLHPSSVSIHEKG